MGFKENVEVLLSRSHWSQRRLAAAAGISSGRVSQILSNPTSPTLVTMTKIAAAFGLEAADMIRDERLPAPGDELEVALRHQGDLSPQAGYPGSPCIHRVYQGSTFKGEQAWQVRRS
jgi:transcriptional regulator with XRE-family HTH domain